MEDCEMAVDRELFADSLPTYLTQFIGRADEINAVCELLQDHRLVSICGVGGAGKTRLAIEVARRRRADSAQEVHWVSLNGISEDREVYAAVADGIGLTGQLPARAVVSALRHRRATIVLDNCEVVRSGCQEFIQAILEDSTDVTFLTTTRVPVGTPTEYLYAIPPLSSFRTTTDAASDASLLFVDRCRLAAPSYGLTPHNTAAIHDICDALNGLPLAIELAASWVRVLSPDDLLGQIRQLRTRIDSRSTIVEERHRSLDAVLASSWFLLDPESRQVLSALSVFVGGFTRNAAEVVAGADLASIATLIERALIQRLPASNGASRYQMHALVREYAWDRAESRRQARDRHAAYFADLVDTLEKGSWNTPVEPSWSDPLGADLANIDEATRWSIAVGHAEEAARLAVGLDAFWVFSSPSAALREERLIDALAMRPAEGATAGVRARAKATHVLGLRTSGSNPAKAKPLMTQARQLFESIGDQGGAAAAIRDHGRACLMLGDVDQCLRDLRESLARCEDAGDQQGAAWCFLVLGWVARSTGDPDGAVKRFIGARQRFDELDSPFGACQSSLELGRLYADLGQWLPALDALQGVLVGVRDERFTANTADLMEVVAVIASFWEQNEAAAQLCGAISTWRETYESASWTGYPSRLDATTRLLRDRLDNRTWAISHAAGRALTPEYALDLVAHQINELVTLVTSRSSGLSAREVEILALVSEGLTNTGIACRLYLSPRTVGAHLRSIFTKLDVTTRTGAVHAASKLLPAPEAGVGTPTES
jgi:predicted ATPase/DNA-binding CsgD family transcriptional regulator